VSPEPEINITHNTCTLWHLLLFAIRFSVKIGKAISLQRMAKPVANASLRQTQSTTGKNGVKKVLCATSIPGLHLPHQQAEACHALPLLLIKDGLGSNIGLNIN
jgi:hypothetical protein